MQLYVQHLCPVYGIILKNKEYIHVLDCLKTSSWRQPLPAWNWKTTKYYNKTSIFFNIFFKWQAGKMYITHIRLLSVLTVFNTASQFYYNNTFHVSIILVG
jgi:hypothetical protein